MSILKLMSVEFDTKTMKLTGGMSERMEEILTNEEMKKVVDAMEIVAEAFDKDTNPDGSMKVEKKKSYEPIEREEEINEMMNNEMKKLNEELGSMIKEVAPLIGTTSDIKKKLIKGVLEPDETTQMLISLSGLSKEEFMIEVVNHFEELMK